MVDPSLWVALVCGVEPKEAASKDCWALMSPRRLANGFAAGQAYRPQWHLENDGYRELKERFGLEKQRWGRDLAAAEARTTLTILVFNTVQVYRSHSGERLAKQGIRQLWRESQAELGRSPVVTFMDDCCGVRALEELLWVLRYPARQGLLPALKGQPQPREPI